MKKILVIAGTATDTQMGVDMVKRYGYDAIFCPLSISRLRGFERGLSYPITRFSVLKIYYFFKFYVIFLLFQKVLILELSFSFV